MDFFPLTDSKKNLILFYHLKFCHNIKFTSARADFLICATVLLGRPSKLHNIIFLQTFKGGVYVL